MRPGLELLAEKGAQLLLAQLQELQAENERLTAELATATEPTAEPG